MARPKKQQIEEAKLMQNTPISAPSSQDYGQLFSKIETLQGKDKKNFCQSLTREEKKAYLDYLAEKDGQMVTGVFRCYEPLGGTVCFTAMAFNGENPIKYEFFDGQTYTIPKYIAKRFENEFQGSGTFYPTNSHILDSMGNPVVGMGKKNRRFGFSSMEFQ